MVQRSSIPDTGKRTESEFCDVKPLGEMKLDETLIFRAIRRRLPALSEQFRGAADANGEIRSAFLDEIARDLARTLAWGPSSDDVE
jgi:hypothetical protein